MAEFVVYRLVTGEIVRAGYAPDGKEGLQADAEAFESVMLYPGAMTLDTDAFHVVINGDQPEVVPKPAPEVVITSAMVDKERDRRIYGSFPFMGKRYQSRQFDQDNIAGAAQLAAMAIAAGAQPGEMNWHGGEDPFVWIAADNTLTPMDAHTVIALGQALFAHRSDHIFAGKTLKGMSPIPVNYRDDSYWPNTN